jgi:hypothetical protein
VINARGRGSIPQKLLGAAKIQRREQVHFPVGSRGRQ